MTMTRATVGELFAGYGGIGLALEDVLDARVAWVSEFDKAPSAILAQRFPDAPNLGDITKIDWSQVEPVDIITGGSPCQDLSPAGKRAGMRLGTRSGLWASMLEAVRILRPSLVIWENVRGATSACASSDADSHLGQCPRCMDPAGRRKHDPVVRALGRVLGDLADIGYDAAWVGLRAADVGAPHGRYRVFVLAWPAADTDRLGLAWAGDATGRAEWTCGQRSTPSDPAPHTRRQRGLAGIRGAHRRDRSHRGSRHRLRRLRTRYRPLGVPDPTRTIPDRAHGQGWRAPTVAPVRRVDDGPA